jgi:hypothetical protein
MGGRLRAPVSFAGRGIIDLANGLGRLARAHAHASKGTTPMIFRRLSVRLRRQDWVGVGIEVVIVVVGVFIGIQMANWNEDRLAAKRGGEFTERLKADLQIEAWNYENQISYFSQVRVNALRAADALSGRAELSDEALLVAAYRATQYSDNTRQRATYDELTSTGELGLLTDPGLRNLAMDLYTMPVFQWFTDEGRNSPYRAWFRRQMPHHVQAAVSSGCGDRVIFTGNYEGIDTQLDYPCHVELPAADIAQAAAILRQDPEALPLIRQRVADTGTTIANLDIFYIDVWQGLQRIAGRDSST